jgi:hypothetical protein
VKYVDSENGIMLLAPAAVTPGKPAILGRSV